METVKSENGYRDNPTSFEGFPAEIRTIYQTSALFWSYTSGERVNSYLEAVSGRKRTHKERDRKHDANEREDEEHN